MNIKLLSLRLAMLLVNALSVSAAAPSINFQPKDQPVVLYQQAAFGVIANGTAPLTYQWIKDAVPIASATNDQIVLTQSQFSDAGRYSVVVSNADGRVTSVEAVLTVNAPKAGDVDCSFACGASINNEVKSIAVQPDGKVLIAGYFTTVHGAARRGIARLNADGTTDHTFMNGVYGAVLSVALQDDGKVLIGGYFTKVTGESRTNIARLNADGTLDTSFQNDLGAVAYTGDFRDFGGVASVAVQADGKVLIGGRFTAVNGVGRTNIARLNADGTLDSGFQNGLSGASGTINTNIVPQLSSIALQSDGKVLIGGRFTEVNGVGRKNIARLNADGSLDSGFQNGLSGAVGSDYSLVSSVAVQSDGKVLIGGRFTTVNGMGRTNIARLNADGTLDTSFQDGLSGASSATNPYGEVAAIAVQSGGKVLIGGEFTTVNGVSRVGIARLNADGTLDNGFQSGIFWVGSMASTPMGDRVAVSSVAVQSSGKIIIGGYELGKYRLVRINADGTLDSGFQIGLSGADNYVHSVAVQRDGKVLIGGSFVTVNGVSRNCIARLNADGTLDSRFQNGASGAVYDFYGARVHSVAVQRDGKVLIGGFFRTVNGVSHHGIARLNADGTLDSGFQPEVGGFVTSVAVQSDGKVLIGGSFGTTNGVSRKIIARLNADGTLDSGFQNRFSGDSGVVWSVAVQADGKVLIGGNFSTDIGVGRTIVARLNADGSLDDSFQNGLSGADASVTSVTVQSDGKVLIGSAFATVDGVSTNNIARLNADGTLDTSFQSALFGAHGSFDYVKVSSVAVQSNGKVLIGGAFISVNGVSRTNIARLNADGTLDSAFQNGVLGDVESVAVQADGKVLIGGSFSTVNGVPVANFARLWGSADVPPQIKNISRSGTELNLSWYAISNRTYRVQYSGNLSGTNWTDLAGDVSATGATASKIDTTPGSASQRFYRVVLLP